MRSILCMLRLLSNFTTACWTQYTFCAGWVGVCTPTRPKTTHNLKSTFIYQHHTFKAPKCLTKAHIVLGLVIFYVCTFSLPLSFTAACSWVSSAVYLASALCGISCGLHSQKTGTNIPVTSLHCKAHGLIGRDSEQVKYCSNIEAEGQRPRKHCECALAQIVGLDLFGRYWVHVSHPLPELLSPFPAHLQSPSRGTSKHYAMGDYTTYHSTRKCVSIRLQNGYVWVTLTQVEPGFQFSSLVLDV